MSAPASSDRLGSELVEEIGRTEMVEVRGGAGEHRFLPIWMVVVDGRVFARSWALGSRNWRDAFARDGVGAIRVGGREVAVEGVPVTDPALNAAISEAYRGKYSPALEVEDMTGADSAATTIEFKAQKS